MCWVLKCTASGLVAFSGSPSWRFGGFSNSEFVHRYHEGQRTVGLSVPEGLTIRLWADFHDVKIGHSGLAMHKTKMAIVDWPYTARWKVDESVPKVGLAIRFSIEQKWLW